MVRRFIVNVNGTAYDVEVEEVSGAAINTAAPAAPAAAPAPVAAPAPAAAPAAGQTSVTAPMPGTILDIKVNVGDTVKADDVVIILEAMKMENEIFAPASGKVIAINTTKGASVNSGDCLLVIG